MDNYPKPNIIVSKCLGFDAVRYNGQMIEDSFVKQLQPFVTFTPVCPEVAINLGVPRMPIRIVKSDKENQLIQPATGKNITKDMQTFANKFLNELKDIDGFILKYLSPTCGIGNVKIYNKQSQMVVEKGKGFFAEKVIKLFPNCAIEDEMRLRNYRIREHWLTKVFTFARLRQVKSMKDLVEFQTKHKFLIMVYNQRKLKELGAIVGNQKQLPFDQVFKLYLDKFYETIQKQPKRTSWINVMMHMSGFFDKSDQENLFFNETMELYRESRIPLTSALNVLKTWTMKDEKNYITNQLVFNPYPTKLIELRDSGKVINIT